MAKSLAEIAAEVTSFLAGRKLDLSEHDFDSLTILSDNQPATAELSLDELRALIAEHRNRDREQGIGGRTWHG